MSVSPFDRNYDYWIGPCSLLGDTLEAIAEQKAGIIKQGIPLVTGRIAQEALAVIDRIAEGKDAPRFAYGTDYQISHQKSVATGEVFDYTSVVRQGRFQTGLLGLHQIENAGMAIALLDTFCQEDGRELVSNHLLAQALEETSWQAFGNRVKRSLDDFGWSPQSPCYQGFNSNLARTLCGLS